MFQLTLKVQHCTRTFVRFVLSYFRTCTCTRVQLYSVHRYTSINNLWNIYRRYLVSPKIFYLRARRAYCTQLHIGFFTYSIVFYFRKYVYCTCTTTCTKVPSYFRSTTYNRLDFHKHLTTLFIRVEILER